MVASRGEDRLTDLVGISMIKCRRDVIAREEAGIPVLASDRGALPETLGDAGFVFTIPERCTPTSGIVPTAQEVAPWVAVIERLWDDPAFEASHRERARLEARRWNGDALAERYEALFHAVNSTA